MSIFSIHNFLENGLFAQSAGGHEQIVNTICF
jgi:hypothetical protein